MPMVTIVTGTLLALPDDTIFYTANGLALGTEQTSEIFVFPPSPEGYLGGKYVPTNYPSGGKPFRF